MTEHRRNEQRVRAALQELEAPDEPMAAERARQVVEAAFNEHAPAPPRSPVPRRAGLAMLIAAAIVGFALTPAGADVREWIADTVDPGIERAETRLGSLPVGGSLLVESRDGVWTVSEDGSRRRLGDYGMATWSPNALFVGVSKGPELAAITPLGETRWVRPVSARVTAFDWSTDDGDRIAYLVGGTDLHVMAADNSSSELLDGDVSGFPPAWRPDLSDSKIRRQLAYGDGDGAIRVIDLDTRRELFSHFPGFEVRSLEWAADGSMLLMAGRETLALRYAPKTAMTWGPGRGGARWSEAAMSPVVNDEVAAVSRSNGRSRLELLRQSSVEKVISFPSRVSDLTWSPNGEWILLGLPDANQWLFVRPKDGEVRAVSNVEEQFESTGSFPRVAGWCC